VPSSEGVIVDLDPTLGVWPHPGFEEVLYRRLQRAHPRLKVYRRDDTPAHWRYGDHPRIPPIIGIVDEGWSILRRERLLSAFSRTARGVAGNHGYDPRVRSMRGMFVAAGPAFRRGASVPAFESVHVYEVLCRVLGIRPAPNDGDPGAVRTLWVTVPARPQAP
jgi:hypothetical protein